MLSTCINSTIIIDKVSRQEAQALQVVGCCSRKGHDFSDSLVETLVGSIPQEVGLVAISHLVLVVTHLMVHCEEVVHVDLGAHFDSEDITGEVLMSAVILCHADMTWYHIRYIVPIKQSAQWHVSDESYHKKWSPSSIKSIKDLTKEAGGVTQFHGEWVIFSNFDPNWCSRSCKTWLLERVIFYIWTNFVAIDTQTSRQLVQGQLYRLIFNNIKTLVIVISRKWRLREINQYHCYSKFIFMALMCWSTIRLLFSALHKKSYKSSQTEIISKI